MEKLLAISLSELINGMVIGESVYDEMGIPLCQKGSVVDDDLRIRLHETGIIELKVLSEVNEVSTDKEISGDSQQEAENVAKMKAFEENMNKSLSTVLHYKEIQEIVAVIRKVTWANMTSEQHK